MENLTSVCHQADINCVTSQGELGLERAPQSLLQAR